RIAASPDKHYLQTFVPQLRCQFGEVSVWPLLVILGRTGVDGGVGLCCIETLRFQSCQFWLRQTIGRKAQITNRSCGHAQCFEYFHETVPTMTSLGRTLHKLDWQYTLITLLVPRRAATMPIARTGPTRETITCGVFFDVEGDVRFQRSQPTQKAEVVFELAERAGLVDGPARVGQQRALRQRGAQQRHEGLVHYQSEGHPAFRAMLPEALNQAAGDEQIAEITRGVYQHDVA